MRMRHSAAESSWCQLPPPSERDRVGYAWNQPMKIPKNRWWRSIARHLASGLRGV